MGGRGIEIRVKESRKEKGREDLVKARGCSRLADLRQHQRNDGQLSKDLESRNEKAGAQPRQLVTMALILVC